MNHTPNEDIMPGYLSDHAKFPIIDLRLVISQTLYCSMSFKAENQSENKI